MGRRTVKTAFRQKTFNCSSLICNRCRFFLASTKISKTTLKWRILIKWYLAMHHCVNGNIPVTRKTIHSITIGHRGQRWWLEPKHIRAFPALICSKNKTWAINTSPMHLWMPRPCIYLYGKNHPPIGTGSRGSSSLHWALACFSHGMSSSMPIRTSSSDSPVHPTQIISQITSALDSWFPMYCGWRLP